MGFQILRLDLSRGDEDAERDRQVEASRLFRQVSRREVDGDALGGKVEAAVLYCSAHAVACFLDFGLGQANQREGRQAVREMHLDGDFGRLQPGERPAFQNGERHRRRLHVVQSILIGGNGLIAEPISIP